MKPAPALDPFSLSLFAWQSALVFTVRGMRLWTEPLAAQPQALADLALEKQRAFADGWLAAGMAAMRGAGPADIAAAALDPARRRVALNARRLWR
ncbi:hypothetical protein M0638_11750 [Roseomonas sp. NAR14]|uniref:Uncharacterized protein n=1 Tax=Roseomonas acroporae TaxID=2937791 RepID=A0A9X1Y7N5_9PROT|nr:hypothetical protein [Roseomonas acroporae]MCK8785058.1 hypothetical protein [Roseomonas acroporae]